MVKQAVNDGQDQSADEQNGLLAQAGLGLGVGCLGIVMFVVFGLLALFAWGVVTDDLSVQDPAAETPARSEHAD